MLLGEEKRRKESYFSSFGFFLTISLTKSSALAIWAGVIFEIKLR